MDKASQNGVIVMGAIMVVVAAAYWLSVGPPENTTSRHVIELTRPGYLAKDAVECGEINVMGTYLDGQQGRSENPLHYPRIQSEPVEMILEIRCR